MTMTNKPYKAVLTGATGGIGRAIALQLAPKCSSLILMGRESIDFNGGMVHGMVGELLGIPSISPVMKLEIEGEKVKMAREIEGGKEYVEAKLPLIDLTIVGMVFNKVIITIGSNDFKNIFFISYQRFV